MSATYIITGQRHQRQFTAAQKTPSYAAASEAAMISSTLCNLPWVKQKNVTPCFPAHPGKDQTDASNVSNRSYFDAALFCAEHDKDAGTHRSFANATCYVFTLPDLASGESARVLESLSVPVNCDPYNAYGVRVAVSTNSTGVIPTSCPECRNGYLSSDTDPTKQTHTVGTTTWASTNTHVEGAAPRSSSGDTWYPSAGTAVISPSGGLTLGKYLYVFVLLENYNTSRNGYLEGSAFADPKMTVVLSSAISGIASGSTVDFSTDPSRRFNITGPGSVASVITDNREFAVFECPRCGVESPERKVYVGPTNATQSPAVVWRASSPSSAQGSYPGVTSVSLPGSLTTKRLIGTAGGTYWSGGLYATYSRSSAPDSSSVVPGVTFYAATQSGTSIDQSLPFTLTALTVSGSQASIPSNALRLLKEGSESTRIFFVGRSFQTDPFQKYGYALVVANDDEAYLVGFLSRGYRSYDTGSGIADGWSFLCLASDYQIGTKSPLTVTSQGNQILPTSDVTISGNTISFSSAAVLPGMFFYTWISNKSDDVTVISASNGSSIGCHGTITGVTSPGRGYIMGRTSKSSVVVSGDLTQVGTVPCSRVAVVDFDSPEQPEQAPLVQVPDYDSALGAFATTDGFSVFPVPTQSDVSPVGYDAIVSSPSGSVVSGTRTYAFYVSGGTMGALPQAIDGVPSNVIFDNCGYVFLAYTRPNSVRYSSTSMDTILQSATAADSAIGLRNCYAKIYSGAKASVSTVKSVQPKVNFYLAQATRTLPISTDFGLTYENVSFPLWRACASVVAIPFSLPVGFHPSSLRLDWPALANATAGSKLNVWYADGVLVKDLSGKIDYSKILPAKDDESGIWTLVGTADATGTNCTFPFSYSGRVGTILLSAWAPQDWINPGTSGSVPAGVGLLDVDPVGGIVTGESSGWFPSIALIG